MCIYLHVIHFDHNLELKKMKVTSIGLLTDEIYNTYVVLVKTFKKNKISKIFY